MQCIFGEQEQSNCVVHLSVYCIVCFAAPHVQYEQLMPVVHNASVVFRRQDAVSCKLYLLPKCLLSTWFPTLKYLPPAEFQVVFEAHCLG